MQSTKIKLFGILFCASGLVAGNTTQKSEVQQKPNIIFILTDDQRWDALGYVGNNIIQTPEMDKLAESGVYFRNGMVTTPICSASRASIFSQPGQYFQRIARANTQIYLSDRANSVGIYG